MKNVRVFTTFIKDDINAGRWFDVEFLCRLLCNGHYAGIAEMICPTVYVCKEDEESPRIIRGFEKYLDFVAIKGVYKGNISMSRLSRLEKLNLIDNLDSLTLDGWKQLVNKGYDLEWLARHDYYEDIKPIIREEDVDAEDYWFD